MLTDAGIKARHTGRAVARPGEATREAPYQRGKELRRVWRTLVAGGEDGRQHPRDAALDL